VTAVSASTTPVYDVSVLWPSVRFRAREWLKGTVDSAISYIFGWSGLVRSGLVGRSVGHMCIQKFNLESEDRRLFEDVSLDGRKILKLFLRKHSVSGLDSSGSLMCGKLSNVFIAT
jgi:hypothetical protein